ncbi:CopD family protein [Devosia sp. 2618]|uniref:CopD family protein n=1 Tax=Devosia sp. 2618 TaxID=3156454 RepID=UPI00339B3807
MIPILIKFVHIVAIAAWSAGLICLPFLYGQRKRLTGDALYRLHNFTRSFYVSLMSPAAFVAVASGIALIFLQGTFEAWFSVKLWLVAVMVIVHVMSGLVILRLFEPGQTYPRWRVWAVTVLTVVIIASILVVVLGKPQWHAATVLVDMFKPGALGVFLGDLIAWWK